MTPIGVNFCVIVELSSGQVFFVAISLGVSKCEVKKEARVDHFLAFQTLIFAV